jgi:hypothetical protein
MKSKNTVLNQQEKEVLKDEVLAELGKENLKKEIVAELQSTNRKYSFSSVTKHPAVLLIIGFVMTGIVGTWLTSSWQQREWDRQQSRLVKIRGVDQKYAVIDETIKAIGENNSVVVEMLRYLINAEGYKYPKQFDEYVIEYGSKRDSGRITSSIIQQKLLIYFRNPKIPELFQQIVSERWQMHQRLNFMIGDYIDFKEAAKKHGWDFKLLETGDFKINGDAIIRTVNDSEDLKQLINLMTEEIQQDVKGLD